MTNQELALESVIECIMEDGQWPKNGRAQFDLYEFLLDKRDPSYAYELLVASMSNDTRALETRIARERKTVEAMSAYGIPQQKIAAVIGICKPTLEKYYRVELDTADAKATAKVAESLFQKATGNHPQSVTAGIFWLKTRAGWKDTTRHEHTGANGGPLQHVDLASLKADDLARLEGILGPLLGSGEGGDSEAG
jgi:hypothetical protein